MFGAMVLDVVFMGIVVILGLLTVHMQRFNKILQGVFLGALALFLVMFLAMIVLCFLGIEVG